jgi:hypothetical protein
VPLEKRFTLIEGVGMNEQAQASPSMTETEAQALAWRLHAQLPLGWHVETVDHDPPFGLGWFVEVRHPQRALQVRLFREADVALFSEQHGVQHPVRFETESFLLEFLHPEVAALEVAEPGHVLLKDVIELIEWGTPHLPFLNALGAKRVRCPTCGRDDCTLVRVPYQQPDRYLWKCWEGHWFTCSYDFEAYEVLPSEPELEPEIDLPFEQGSDQDAPGAL